MSKIPVRTLHQQVADRIREMIRKGVLNKGQKIAEAEMCRELGISRTPLREALHVLSSEGLIDLTPNKGAYIAQPSMNDIREMFEVMSILEGVCARVATEKMKPNDFKKIKKLHSKLEKHYQKKDHEKYLSVNQELHMLIQQLTGNKILNEVINGLRQKILLYRYRQLYQPDRFDQSIQEHRELLKAFEEKDAAAAENAMKRHLMNQCEALVVLYEDGPRSDRWSDTNRSMS